MKKVIRQIMALAALCGAMAGCSSDEVFDQAGEGVGYLRLDLGKVDVELSSTTKATSKLPDEFIPETTNDFMIDIRSGNTSVDGYPKKFSEISSGIELEAGTYTVSASYGENEPLQEVPYFSGSTSVRVLPGQTVSEDIEVALTNAMLVPAVSENLTKHYEDWTLTIEAGGTSLTLAEKDNSDGYLFAKAGQSVNAVFEGTNLLGNETSNEWTVIASAAARTKYVIQCDPDIPVFSFGLNAVAEHTTDASGYLNGTKVSLSFGDLSNVPVSLISDWKATLVNASGEVVRSYSTSDFSTAGEMTIENAWPYLPQGNYTLRYSYTIDGETVSEENMEPQTVAMPQPTFTVEAIAQTSYSVYTSEGAAAANEKDGASIFDVSATTTISPDILSDEKYAGLLSVTYTLDTGESSTEVSPVFSNLQWGKRKLTAVAVFDGSSATSAIDCGVTGIPYRGDYTNQSPFDDTRNPWIAVGDGEYWGGHGYILFQYEYGFFNPTTIYNNYVFSPAFQVPTTVDISYSTKVAYFTWGSTGSYIDVYTGVSDKKDTPVVDKTTPIERIYKAPASNLEDNKFTPISEDATIENNYRICISHDGERDDNGAEDWLTFKSLEVLYR